MQTDQTHKEYYEHMAQFEPWHSHRPVAYIIAPWALLSFVQFAMSGNTLAGVSAMCMLHLMSKAWTFEWFTYQVRKLYGETV